MYMSYIRIWMKLDIILTQIRWLKVLILSGSIPMKYLVKTSNRIVTERWLTKSKWRMDTKKKSELTGSRISVFSTKSWRDLLHRWLSLVNCTLANGWGGCALTLCSWSWGGYWRVLGLSSDSVLAEDPDLIPSTNPCKSSPRGFNTLLWSPWAPNMHMAHRYAYKQT